MENCVLQCETTGVTVRTSAEFLMKTSDLYGAKVGPPRPLGVIRAEALNMPETAGPGGGCAPHSHSLEGLRNFGLSRPDSVCEVLIGRCQSR